jgi:3-hydroxyacyl-CoA dehydrogenase/enoyl-CoA hydratase/3-hydroxybutyryl-CoA epimerase
MVMGTGFPPFRGGLLRYADTLGARRVTDRLEELAGEAGRGSRRPSP